MQHIGENVFLQKATKPQSYKNSALVWEKKHYSVLYHWYAM